MKKRDFFSKVKKWTKLIGLIYLFVLAIEIIKKSSLLLAPNINDFLLQNLTPLKAVSFGWFTTSIVQSSGALGSVAAAFAGYNLISLPTAVYLLIGASLGTTITALIISLVTATKQRRDFRHGFEIALCYSIYAIFLVIFIFILEYFFGIFSGTSLYLANLFQGKLSFLMLPDLVGTITSPIINLLFKIKINLFLLILGFGFLIFTLRFLGKSVIEVLGGEDSAKRFINKFFDSKIKAYFVGVILTAIVFSSSITIGLLVPLAVSRLISLKKAIPFILGADLGTFTDVFLASIILGNTNSLATAFIYFLISLFGGLIFLPNVNFLHKTTKYVSKRLIRISRRKALYVLLGFILIPLLVILIF